MKINDKLIFKKTNSKKIDDEETRKKYNFIQNKNYQSHTNKRTQSTFRNIIIE